MKAPSSQFSQPPEPSIFDGAGEEFVRPVFEIPHRLEIDLMTTADDPNFPYRQALSQAFLKTYRHG